MEKIIFGHVTIGMLITFLLGIAFVFLYSEWKYKNSEDNGYGIRRYLKWSWINFAFYIVGGLLLLLPIDGLGELFVSVLKKAWPDYNFDAVSHMVFSAIAGMAGAPIVAWGLEKFRKKRNASDTNIKHVHDDNCAH